MSGSAMQRLLQRCGPSLNVQVRSNAYRSSIGSVVRQQYLRRYPMELVRPDGSTIAIRAAEPMGMFALPVDLKQLSAEERMQALAARKPKTKKIVQERIDDNFDASAYMSMWSDAPPPAEKEPPVVSATSSSEAVAPDAAGGEGAADPKAKGKKKKMKNKATS